VKELPMENTQQDKKKKKKTVKRKEKRKWKKKLCFIKEDTIYRVIISNDLLPHLLHRG